MTGWKICFLKSELHKHDEYEQTFSYRNEATFPTIIELKYAVGNLKILAKRNKWSRASFMQIIAVSCWSVNRITFETFKNVININLGAKNKTCSMNWEVLICFVASAQCCLFRSTQIECSVGNNNVCFVWMGLFCWSSHIKIRRFQALQRVAVPIVVLRWKNTHLNFSLWHERSKMISSSVIGSYCVHGRLETHKHTLT